MITGYFLVNSSFKFEKLLKIWVSVFTYSFPIYLIFLSIGVVDFHIKQAIVSFFPIIFNTYWFITTYVLLYVFSPFINIFIRAIDKRTHLYVIMVLTFVWSVVPTFTPASLNFSAMAWFSTLYIIGAYLRLYPNIKMTRVSLTVPVVCYLFVLSSIVVFDFAGLKARFFGIHATYFVGMNKLPIVVCAVTLFIAFKNLKLSNIKLINIISSSMLGVYLIHGNQFIRKVLWIDVFKNYQYYESDILILHAVISILFVFFACIAIDLIKQKTIDKSVFRLLRTIVDSKLIFFLWRHCIKVVEMYKCTPKELQVDDK
ncbi:acyltransferase family protein [Pseudodesulfovibrio methanolicus]|uniref:Acyltransferase family protein n=1 Tax=Pseudodesulfovibrio methanolicus TaxID=3126690 RepID=A0ABZ2IYQ7_9BACT